MALKTATIAKINVEEIKAIIPPLEIRFFSFGGSNSSILPPA